MSAHLLLLTGVPGTGKTTVANYLALHHGFTHYDREDIGNWDPALRRLWLRALPAFVMTARLANPKIVISWGFMPGRDDDAIHELIALGFKMYWFDGDRAAARSLFTERNTLEVRAFDQQVARIDLMDLEKFEHRYINVFRAGKIRPVEDVARDVLEHVV